MSDLGEIQVISHRVEVNNEVESAIASALEECGIMAEAYAKLELTESGAVDTGNLRNSVTHAVGEDEMVIGTNVEYAPYIEMGTSRMAARPYLKPALSKHVDEYVNILKGELSG